MWSAGWLRRGKRHASSRKRPAFRPSLEALEGRCVPSTLTVTNLNDNNVGATLRNEIAAAQSGDTIVFAKGVTGTIRLYAGSSWPWPTGGSARSKKPAPSLTGRCSGWTSTSRPTRSCAASAPKPPRCSASSRSNGISHFLQDSWPASGQTPSKRRITL